MSLGERIRELRKEKKMTLQQLAGDAITKGMLSLIENNKAKPSMESLQHIASSLEVSVSDLLEDSSSTEKKEIVRQAEELYKKLSYPDTKIFSEILNLIAPHLPAKGRGYLDARLLDLYTRIAYESGNPDWKSYCSRAITLYEEIQVARRAASLRLFRISVKFREKQYEEALRQLLEERQSLEQQSVWTDPLSRLDYDYSEAVFYYAVGQQDKALDTMHAAIEFSKQQKVFYRLDHLYRLAIIHAIMAGNEKEAKMYISRLEAYGLFTDDAEVTEFIQLIWVHYYTSYTKQIDEADKLMQKILKTSKPLEELDSERVEYAKILYYKEQIDKAQEVLENTPPPPYFVTHPIDLSMYSEREYYLAKIYQQQGESDKALAIAEEAWEQLDTFLETPYKTRMRDLIAELNSTN